MPKKIVAPKVLWNYLTRRRYCEPPRCIPKVSSISSGAFKDDLRRLLPDRLSRQEDRNQAILSPRQSVARMARDLKKEMSISAFVKQLSGFGPFNR